MDRPARAVASLPDSHYELGDIAGLIYQNSLLEARLVRYPGLLALGERPEFQALGQDTSFGDTRLKGGSVNELLGVASFKAIVDSRENLDAVFAAVKPDVKDLGFFLTNGVSLNPAYADPLLGRWRFDSTGTMNAYRRVKPNIVGGEATRIRAWMHERFAKCVVVAAPDKSLTLKNFAMGKLQPGAPGGAELKNYSGQWKEDGASYQFILEGGTQTSAAKFEGSRLMVIGEGATVAFTKED
jgi:hypothetical protein